jgi:hypothetical protein
VPLRIISYYFFTTVENEPELAQVREIGFNPPDFFMIDKWADRA